jgi:hypothetical protein
LGIVIDPGALAASPSAHFKALVKDRRHRGPLQVEAHHSVAKVLVIFQFLLEIFCRPAT